MTNKEKLILEDKFNIYESENGEIDLETWTNGGVNMFIYLDTTSEETITQQFRNYVDNFDIDEEIDLHRQGEDYKNAFTIIESVNDFENYLDWLKCILTDLEDNSTDIECLCKRYTTKTLIQLYTDDFNISKDTLELFNMIDDYVVKKFLIEKFESNYNFDVLRTKLNNRLEV